MSKIYVPELNNGNCVHIQSTDIIRVYESTPRANATINYKDYYIKSSYIYNEGSQNFTNYSTLPTCISSDRLTTEYAYRNDFADIIIIAFALIFMGYFFVSKIVRAIFVGWRYA